MWACLEKEDSIGWPFGITDNLLLVLNEADQSFQSPMRECVGEKKDLSGELLPSLLHTSTI